MLYVSRKWGLWTEEFKQRAKKSSHPREKEKWLALSWVSEGMPKAEVGRLLGRHYNTIISWIDLYNEYGPERMAYSPPPGQESWLKPPQQTQFRDAIQKPPAENGIEGVQWTYKQVIEYCKRNLQLEIGERAAQKYIRKLGFVRKKPRQRYKRASEEKKRIPDPVAGSRGKPQP